MHIAVDETWSVSKTGVMLTPILTTALNRKTRVIAFALMSHRDEAAYTRVFAMLREAVETVAEECHSEGRGLN